MLVFLIFPSWLTTLLLTRPHLVAAGARHSGDQRAGERDEVVGRRENHQTGQSSLAGRGPGQEVAVLVLGLSAAGGANLPCGERVLGAAAGAAAGLEPGKVSHVFAITSRRPPHHQHTQHQLRLRHTLVRRLTIFGFTAIKQN